jgi:ABC-2 type transport system permease protein
VTRLLTWTEIKLLTREPLTLLVSLLFPVVLMVLLAGSFGNDPDPDFGGVGGVDFYVPVYTGATIAVMGLLGIPTHLAAYRQQGVLRRLRAAGISAPAVMAAQVAVMTVLVTVGVATMVAIGILGYDLSTPVSAAGVVVGLAVGTAAFAGIGLLLGAALPTPRAAQGLGLLLFFGLFFIAGGGPPPALLPDAVNRFVDLTPMGPLVRAISDPWHGHGLDLPALAALTGVAVVTSAIAARRLRRD